MQNWELIMQDKEMADELNKQFALTSIIKDASHIPGIAVNWKGGTQHHLTNCRKFRQHYPDGPQDLKRRN